jgi:hypothetical protein
MRLLIWMRGFFRTIPIAFFVEFAINDALTGNNISPQQSRDNLNTMIDRVLENHSGREIILMTMNPA